MKSRAAAMVIGCGISLSAFGAFASAASEAFRVTPYVQHPATNAMTVLWLTASGGDATIAWWPEGRPTERQSVAVTPREATELGYFGYSHAKQYLPALVPWQYRARLTGLAPDTRYAYTVTIPGGASYSNVFRTAPSAFRPVRFIAYSDSETQPSSTGDKVVWENYADDRDTRPDGWTRKYFIDQTEGYASNICTMVSRAPEFYVIAGDLAEKGSDQTHWDEFWRHNAGGLNDPAGSTPILAAPGNHEYHGYYKADDYGERAMKKYLSYFEYEPNGAAVDSDQQQRFHRMDYGPVAVIFIDPNNGPDYYPDTTAATQSKEMYTPNYRDTNQCLTRDVCRAPDFNEGSEQYHWLEEQLADAQTNKLFTFLVCHQCPFSCGYHGRLNGDKGFLSSAEYLSGAATRCLTNLVFRYGVDAWICGHDEIYEHSQVKGTEILPDGTTAPITLNVYDVGIGGDGLRGCRRTSDKNPHEVFRAHVNALEVYDANGILQSGGKHYGHLEVNVCTNEQGYWTTTLTPAYVFVSTNAGGVASFERRVYADEIVVTNTTYTKDVPLPQGKIKTGWDIGDYVQTGLAVNYDGIRNVGATAPHSTATNRWHDVAPGSTRSAPLTRLNVSADAGSWTENGYRFAYGSWFPTPTCPSLGMEFTLQLVSTVNLPQSVGNLLLRGRGDFNCAKVDPTETKAGWTPKTYSGVNPATLNPWHGQYWNGAFDSSYIYETEGTTWESGITPLARTAFEAYVDPDFTIGGYQKTYLMNGDIHAFRAYTHKLTNAELARNRLVDDIRFRGKTVTNVVVAANVYGLTGAEEPGAYAVDGHYIFTAPTVSDGKSVHVATGYTLETWKDGAWGAPVAYEGASYVCANDWASGAAAVRLTWKWQRTQALQTAADFTLEDYVTDGLVAFYDGIHNAGADKPHDPAATVWKDVSGKGNDTLSMTVSTSGQEGEWTDTSYRFAGGSAWNTPYVTSSLGLEFTVQLATTVAIPPQTHQLLVRGAKNLQCALVYATESNTHWVSDGLAGTKPSSLGPWKGDYWNCAMDATTAYEAHGTDWEASKGAVRFARTAFTSYDNPDFAIGGYKNAGWAVGDVHAFRVYSRKLTNAELVQNRAADEARYHGRLAVTNVLVAANGRGLAGTQEAGAYTVRGGWTFTAEPIVREIDGHAVTFTPVGCTIETWTGSAWANPVYQAGAAYEYVESAQPVRLTWKWHSDAGLYLIVR